MVQGKKKEKEGKEKKKEEKKEKPKQEKKPEPKKEEKMEEDEGNFSKPRFWGRKRVCPVRFYSS